MTKKTETKTPKPRKRSRKKKPNVTALITHTDVDVEMVLKELEVAKHMAKKHKGTEVTIVMSFVDGDCHVGNYTFNASRMAGLLEQAKLETLYPFLAYNEED